MKQTLGDKIAFILSSDFCRKIINSPRLNDVCEGDCVSCRTSHIFALVETTAKDIKRLAVPSDNNIRYKVDKATFDELIGYLLEY